MKPHFYRERGMWHVRFPSGVVCALCWESGRIVRAFDHLMRYTLNGVML